MKYEKDHLKKSIIRAYSTEENLLHVDMVVVMHAQHPSHILCCFLLVVAWCVYFRPLPRHRLF